MGLFEDAIETEQEYRAIFGEHPSIGMDQNVYLLANLRAMYSHEQLMSGQFTMPTGLGFFETALQAGKTLGLILKAAAPFIAMIPGIGLGVSMAITAGAGLAAGDRIDYVAIDAMETAIPDTMPNAKKQFREAVDLGYAAARGQRVDKALVDLGRSEAAAAGGPEAAAAFDAGIAVGTGKGLQESGFALMGAWVKGDGSPSARAIQFGLDVREAALRGVSVKDFLIGQAQREFFDRFPPVERAFALKTAIEFLLAHPEELVNPQLADLAERVGIPVEAIRAAIICIMKMNDGTLLVDPQIAPSFEALPPKTAGRMNADGMTAINDDRAARGYAMALANPKIMALRSKVGSYGQQINIDGPWRRGFDIGTFAASGKSKFDAGQEAARNAIPNISEYNGFNAAAELQYKLTALRPNLTSATLRTGGALAMATEYKSVTLPPTPQEIAYNATNDQYAERGRLKAAADPRLTAARELQPEGAFRRGFDIGVEASMGNMSEDPWHKAIKDNLGPGHYRGSNEQLIGFSVAQALSYGITKQTLTDKALAGLSGNPSVAAGQLVTNGLTTDTLTPAQKAAVMSTVVTDPLARQGAQTAIAEIAAEQNKSIWTRIAEFFGF